MVGSGIGAEKIVNDCKDNIKTSGFSISVNEMIPFGCRVDVVLACLGVGVA